MVSPFVVIEAVEVDFIAKRPFDESAIPEEKVSEPYMSVEAVFPNVPVKPVKFKLRQLPVVEPVTVTAPLAASKNTSSELVGTAEPPPPPEVVAHFVPAVASHVDVPPTQYLFAILFNIRC